MLRLRERAYIHSRAVWWYKKLLGSVNVADDFLRWWLPSIVLNILSSLSDPAMIPQPVALNNTFLDANMTK